jgi:hypothetical protein
MHINGEHYLLLRVGHKKNNKITNVIADFKMLSDENFLL